MERTKCTNLNVKKKNDIECEKMLKIDTKINYCGQNCKNHCKRNVKEQSLKIIRNSKIQDNKIYYIRQKV